MNVPKTSTPHTRSRFPANHTQADAEHTQHPRLLGHPASTTTTASSATARSATPEGTATEGNPGRRQDGTPREHLRQTHVALPAALGRAEVHLRPVHEDLPLHVDEVAMWTSPGLKPNTSPCRSPHQTPRSRAIRWRSDGASATAPTQRGPALSLRGAAFGIRTHDLRITRPSEIVTDCDTWSHHMLFSQVSTPVTVPLLACCVAPSTGVRAPRPIAKR